MHVRPSTRSPLRHPLPHPQPPALPRQQDGGAQPATTTRSCTRTHSGATSRGPAHRHRGARRQRHRGGVHQLRREQLHRHPDRHGQEVSLALKNKMHTFYVNNLDGLNNLSLKPPMHPRSANKHQAPSSTREMGTWPRIKHTICGE